MIPESILPDSPEITNLLPEESNSHLNDFLQK